MLTNSSPKTLRTTATLVAILKQLEAIDGARVSGITERMDKPRSTIYGHLATFKQEQFIIKEGNFHFTDPELLRLGNQIQTWEPVFTLARQFTKRLLGEIHLRPIFTVEISGKVVFPHTVSGSKMGWSHEQLDSQLFLHGTAVGEAILVELPEPRIEQVLDRRGLLQETENIATDREALFEELERAHERGCVVSRAKNFNELYAIGIAATRRLGDAIGSFSVTGPAHPMTSEDRKAEFAHTVKGTVSGFELELTLT